jgi:hypothetical protein
LSETNKNFSIEFQRLDSRVSDSLIQPFVVAAVSGLFGAIASLLAATGLCGVIAYSAAAQLYSAVEAAPRY